MKQIYVYLFSLGCWFSYQSIAWAQDVKSEAPDSQATETKQTSEASVELTAEAAQAAAEMRETLDAESEASAMLNSILTGQSMGPTDGWFAMAKPQSQFSWESVLQRFDADGNGKVQVQEFPGSADDFQAIDRNRDQVWSQEDWDWASTRGSDTFRTLAGRLDANEDGEVSSLELERFFQNREGSSTKLSLEQLRQLVDPPKSQGSPAFNNPSESQLVLGLKYQEIGSHQAGPNVGDLAPDFQLTDLQGMTHSLADSLKSKPTVLIFGNFTCGPFRSQAGNIRDLIRRYQSRVNFLMIYVREAHPSDGWSMQRNEAVGIAIAQPQTYQQRKAVAQRCAAHFDAGVPLMVDTMDDSVGAVYSGMPARLYLIDPDQRVVYKSGRGPHFFFPSDLENAVVMFLNR